MDIAPALAVIFAIVSSSVKFSDTAEAYGWVGTGQLIGAALGFLFPAVFRRWHPDLRDREVGPIADTEPVAVQPS